MCHRMATRRFMSQLKNLSPRYLRCRLTIPRTATLLLVRVEAAVILPEYLKVATTDNPAQPLPHHTASNPITSSSSTAQVSLPPMPAPVSSPIRFGAM